MSIIDTLVTDRTQADVDALKAALYRIKMGVGSEADWEAVKDLHNKGAYNYTDLNRVLEAVSYLHERLKSMGYRPDIRIVGGQSGGTSGTTSKLPEGYIELEYIQSSGTQYIDARFKPNQDTRVETKLDITTEASVTKAIFGCRDASKTNSYAVWQVNSLLRYDYFSDNHYSEVSPYGLHTIITDAHTAYFDDYIQGANKSTFNTSYNMTIFSVNDGGKVDERMVAAKLYYFKIYDNGTLVRDFVPCIDDSGEVGLYDLVSMAFYGNSGTGTFLAGPAVDLPDGYTRLEYIQSSGTQRINTQFIPNQDTRVVLKYGGCSETEWREVLGSGISSSNPENNFVIVQRKGTGVQAQYGSEYYAASATDDGAIIDLNKNLYYVNGSLVHTFTYTAFTSPYNMFLFDAAVSNSEAYSGYSGKFYYCQIYDNSALVRLYTPCISTSGEIGLYDSVSRAFYGNVGTGVFTAGPVVENNDTTPEEDTGVSLAEQDWMTPEREGVYLTNLSNLRAIFTMYVETPKVPTDLENLTFSEANDMEQILIDLETILNTMLLTRVPCGDAYCGGDYL